MAVSQDYSVALYYWPIYYWPDNYWPDIDVDIADIEVSAQVVTTVETGVEE